MSKKTVASRVSRLLGTGMIIGCGAVLAGGLSLGGCEQKGPPPMPPSPANRSAPAAPAAPATPQPATPAPAAQPAAGGATSTGIIPPPAATDGNTILVGGIAFFAPEGWKPAPIRDNPFAPVADLRKEHAAGEVRAAFFAVEGGGVQANLQRWQRQMSDAGEPKITTSTIGGLNITRIEMTGTYAGMNPTGGAAAAVANTRFVGLYIDGGNRPVQVRVTGPKQAVDEVLPAFDAMLQTIKKP
ncbi:MAG: hypothetical protein MUE97_07310 [Phycisphaerales bacterium]|jgi:hypothetical protein|nr:hypothetical protein [Phycisphaerales bacterium]